MPDPMMRSCWTNAAVISPATAERLGVDDNQVVEIRRGEATLALPVYIMPGQADDSIAVALGYGRAEAGSVGGSLIDRVEPVGGNAYALQPADGAMVAGGVELKPTAAHRPVPCVQDHFAIDTVGRRRTQQQAEQLIREASLEHYHEHPHFAAHMEHHPPLESLWEEWEYNDNKWGMSIDLSRCIGCGACVMACQAENNIPVVGPERVLEGREMLWLRVDRYFKGDPANPQAATQPVACHHCEMAPCEQVCPVNATVHSHEGLNDMVYNRCVGTRYCSNNCPFKVRRFNYFNYHTELNDPANETTKMKYNPEVTVRSRGVMEKCTYCVQRIQAAKIRAKNERRPVRDGEIQTACQQACPTGAIVFGNLNDRASTVANRHENPRAYKLLQGLNLKVRTAYLARIRNPHPKLA
jgi:molybdopterin-containing oxidoreductase family iron-sulfur binding subunit